MNIFITGATGYSGGSAGSPRGRRWRNGWQNHHDNGGHHGKQHKPILKIDRILSTFDRP